MTESNMAKKIEFLYQSINDVQNTIRAIDVKIGFLFIIAFMPITLIRDGINPLSNLWEQYDICKLLLCITVISWALSIFYLFQTLTSISNPSSHIYGQKPNGIFNGDAFFRVESSLIGSRVKANYSINDIYSLLPDEHNIVCELIYEKMKLTYIREIKFYRYARCTILFYIWLTISICLYIYSLIDVSTEVVK